MLVGTELPASPLSAQGLSLEPGTALPTDKAVTKVPGSGPDPGQTGLGLPHASPWTSPSPEVPAGFSPSGHRARWLTPTLTHHR